MFFVKERASREAATTCREAARRESKTSCYLTFLSCRWQGQDLTLWCWLVDIFRNMQINLIGSFDCNYWGDAEDISHLLSFGKFCFPLPGKKIVCKISENCKGWQAAHLHWRKTFENLLHIASVRRTLSGILHFKHWMMIWLGSNGGVVVRALPSHQCGRGSVPRSVSWVCCWFSPLLQEVFLRVLWFSPLLKTNISKFQFDQESGRRRTTMWMCYLQIVIYLFLLFYILRFTRSQSTMSNE